MKNQLSKVMENKESYYDEVVEDWRERYTNGESLIEHLEEQWRECDRCPSLFSFLDESPCQYRMAKNRAFLSEKFPGRYIESLVESIPFELQVLNEELKARVEEEFEKERQRQIEKDRKYDEALKQRQEMRRKRALKKGPLSFVPEKGENGQPKVELRKFNTQFFNLKPRLFKTLIPSQGQSTQTSTQGDPQIHS